MSTAYGASHDGRVIVGQYDEYPEQAFRMDASGMTNLGDMGGGRASARETCMRVAAGAIAKKYLAEYKVKADHNAMKGYTGMHAAKAIFDKIGKLDPKAFARAMHGASISAKDYPGVLFDVRYDERGDLDRESFFVKVVGGQAQVIETLRPAR